MGVIVDSPGIEGGDTPCRGNVDSKLDETFNVSSLEQCQISSGSIFKLHSLKLNSFNSVRHPMVAGNEARGFLMMLKCSNRRSLPICGEMDER